MKSRKPLKTRATSTTKSVTSVRHSQQETSNSNDKFRSTFRSACERCERARKMRQVWNNHAARDRSLRELPLARGIGRRERTIARGLSRRPRRGRCAAQILVPGKLRNPRTDRLRWDGRDLSRPATTFTTHRGGKAGPELSR